MEAEAYLRLEGYQLRPASAVPRILSEPVWQRYAKTKGEVAELLGGRKGLFQRTSAHSAGGVGIELVSEGNPL